jgi:hypothetical protein
MSTTNLESVQKAVKDNQESFGFGVAVPICPLNQRNVMNRCDAQLSRVLACCASERLERRAEGSCVASRCKTTSQLV